MSFWNDSPAWFKGLVVVVAIVGIPMAVNAILGAPSRAGAPAAVQTASAPPFIEYQPPRVETPAWSDVREHVRRALPEMKAQIAAGRAKARSGAACEVDMRARQKRLRALLAETLGTRAVENNGNEVGLWAQPQKELATDLTLAVDLASECVDCEQRHAESCALALAEVAKAERRIARDGGDD